MPKVKAEKKAINKKVAKPTVKAKKAIVEKVANKKRAVMPENGLNANELFKLRQIHQKMYKALHAEELMCAAADKKMKAAKPVAKKTRKARAA